MARFLPAPPTRIPCLLRRPSAADSAAAVEESAEAEGIGTREAAGTGGTSTTIAIGTHEVGRRKADGDGNRMTGIAETAGTPTLQGTFETTARSGIGKRGTAN